MVPHRRNPEGLDKANKRMYAFNYHDNSDDYKNLGTLHKENRTVEYYPQDEKEDFTTKPQIMGKPPMSTGSRQLESNFSLASDDQEVKGFPKTTNQDFHNEDCHVKARALATQMDKQNFKRNNPYMAFVNANFNQGVFVNPWQDQV